jgi:hypothetical protein
MRGGYRGCDRLPKASNKKERRSLVNWQRPDDQRVFLIEKWPDQEALDAHAKGPMPGNHDVFGFRFRIIFDVLGLAFIRPECRSRLIRLEQSSQSCGGGIL